ncbi:MAG TPA: sensor histidine kinase [Crenotrichaceae bacterium]|nr:sensor histidine kinase [Crenotrichaceae bacterium]
MTKCSVFALRGLNKKTLRRWLTLFFLALALPSAVLIQQSLARLDLEVFHQHRSLAEKLVERIDAHFQQLIINEEKRAFTDYVFLNIAGDPAAGFLQQSPLSTYPPESAIPGVIGYFQVDAQGMLQTPLLPNPASTAKHYGISEHDFDKRLALQNRIQEILADNRLLRPARQIHASSAKTNVILQQHKDSNEQHDSVSQQIGIVVDSQSPLEPKKVESAQQNQFSTFDSIIPSQEFDAFDKHTEKATPVTGQAGFDQLKWPLLRKKQKTRKPQKTLGQVADLNLDDRYQAQLAPAQSKQLAVVEETKAKLEKRARIEQNSLPEFATESLKTKAYSYTTSVLREKSDTVTVQKQAAPSIRIRTFESEIDPFEFSLLDSNHFVLFRKVWRNNQRYIQGMLVDQQVFLKDMINTTFQASMLASISNLLVAYHGDVYSMYHGQINNNVLSSTQNRPATLLYQDHLSSPFNELELILSIHRLPTATASFAVSWTAALLLLVLSGGLYLVYQTITKQIELNRQQQNFVSAVSHELKTPLTSIRLYGEILQEGWASEEKQKQYHNFIVNESERLSRLINNVLQLARMTRNKPKDDIKKLTVSELLDIIHSKVTTQAKTCRFSPQHDK